MHNMGRKFRKLPQKRGELAALKRSKSNNVKYAGMFKVIILTLEIYLIILM